MLDEHGGVGGDVYIKNGERYFIYAGYVFWTTITRQFENVFHFWCQISGDAAISCCYACLALSLPQLALIAKFPSGSYTEELVVALVKFPGEPPRQCFPDPNIEFFTWKYGKTMEFLFLKMYGKTHNLDTPGRSIKNDHQHFLSHGIAQKVRIT